MRRMRITAGIMLTAILALSFPASALTAPGDLSAPEDVSGGRADAAGYFSYYSQYINENAP
jgi:hypothetical protein